MISIFEGFRKKKLNYTAFSLSESSAYYSKYNVFEDNSNFFRSKNDVSDQWWQVLFQIPVVIDSYLIKAHDEWLGRIKSWIINISIDNKNWETIDTVNNAEIYNNNNKEKLDKTATCTAFRIVSKGNYCTACSNNGMIFSYIDIFGNFSFYQNHGCTCKRINSRISSFSLIFIYSFVHIF